MGLRIIYGKAGSGKSKFIFDEIDEKIKNKEKNKIFIITPEQFSYTAEQKLMENKKSVINIEVISFNRLAYRVINEIGGSINTNLTKSGKAMLIYSILQKEKNNLEFLSKSIENVDLSMRIITELKKHSISVEDLNKEQEKIEDKYLKNKLNDIIIIYKSFEEIIKNQYIDETDLLTILMENIDKIQLLKNADIYIDEFSGFTEQEYSIIKKIIEIANKVTITSCIDNLDFNTNPNIDIFYNNKITIKKIIDLLEENKNIEYINLNKLYRFKNEELIYLENNLYKNKIRTYEEKVKYINLFLAKNEYSEIENVAKKISNIIKEEKIRYKDISIITKNIEKYSNLTRAIFSEYDIPVFIDEKRDLNQNIVIQYVLSIIEIFIKNYSYESFFNYLKTGFVDIEEEDIFKLEKYCIKYGIKNNKLKKDLVYGINEKNKEEINYLNEIRKKTIDKLTDLQNKINEEKNIKNIIESIYSFLISQNIEEKLNKKINKLEENNFLDLAKEYKESYKILIDIFDEMIMIFYDDKITLEKFSDILKIGFRNSGLGKIPGKIDQVIMGDSDRSRSRKSKVVFIIGLNDGIFPSINTNEGFIDDKEREFLKDEGIVLAKGTLENLYDDNFNIYKAFTTSEEKLFLSYSLSDIDGKSLRPSSLIFKIKKIFPGITEESDLIEKNIEFINEKKLYENLILEINKIKNGKEPDELFYLIFEYYKNNKKYNKLLNDNIKYINYNFNEKIKNENMEKIYGNNLNTSISQLEKYNSCPFSYFLKYILNLKEKEELKIQSIDTGSFMHDVINEFFEKISNENILLKNINNEELEKITEKIINEKLLNNNYYIFTATEKYKLLIIRLKRIINKALKYIIQSIVQSDFEVEGTEVSFSNKGKYKPIILKLENGKQVEISGKIDRIDIAKEDNNYVRIIDYKSSIKNIDFSDIYSGLQLQLITYLDAVCKEEDLIPAGILYFNLLEQIINSDKKLSEEEIEEKIKNNFKMKGLILADVKVAKLHDKNLDKGSSNLIPAYIDSTGELSYKRSSILTADEFKKLQKHINKTIREISKEIYKGNFEIKPYYKNKKTPCEYCEYKNICNFNTGVCKENYRYLDKVSKDEIFDKI